MDFDPADIRPAVFYQRMIHSIVPRPIAWVSTISESGVTNVAPFSYFTGVGSRPPTLLFCPANNREGQPKDTLRNIQATKDFVVNIVPYSLSEPMNQSASALPSDDSEFDACGLTAGQSVRVRAPRVAESPINFECRLRQVINVGEGPGGANVVLGDVAFVHIEDRILDDRGLVDPSLLDAVGRMGGLSYCRTQDRFDLPRPE